MLGDVVLLNMVVTGLVMAFTGSRSEKQWFRVNDQGRSEYLLNTLPRAPKCLLEFDSKTRKTLKDLFNLLRVSQD